MENFIILVVEERQKNFKWKSNCMAVSRKQKVYTLIQHLKNKEMDASSLCESKTKKLLSSFNEREIGEVYDDYHDFDDKMSYITVLSHNVF